MERVFDEIVVAVEDSAVGLEIRLDILNDLGPQGMLFLSTLLHVGERCGAAGEDYGNEGE